MSFERKNINNKGLINENQNSYSEKVFELWIKTLKSKKYKPGRWALRSCGDEYCCLGVLCDLAAKDGGEQWSRKEYSEYYTLHGQSGLPDLKVTDWLGLSRKDVETLVSKNDIAELSFKEIADYIETELAPKCLNELSLR
ncbi:MAG: hypothetical protein ACRDBG_09645 [Waterburya sp.]